MKPTFFPTQSAFRAWLEKNHATAVELWVGFYRKDSAKIGLTYLQALDEALCFGWIDGIRQKTSADSYTNRFTPRKTGSRWSEANIRHVARLTAAGQMHAAGLAVFNARAPAESAGRARESRPEKFPAAFEKFFRSRRRAWEFWCRQPPGYRRTAIRWVVSAKQDATRQRRLAQLVADSAASRRLSIIAGPARTDPGRDEKSPSIGDPSYFDSLPVQKPPSSPG